jgi:hypothetical protein
MPLRDHFRPPVNDTHSWDEVHGQWPGEIVRTLKPLLPPGFRAAPQVHLGSPFEVDVSTYDLDTHNPISPAAGGGVATLAALAPTYTVEAELADQDEYEVRIYDAERGRTLVAAIELVSPSNKDRPEHRELFVGKVAALLRQDVCVSIVDTITVRRANLYANLLTLHGLVDPELAPAPPNLYAVTLRCRRPPKGRLRLDAWFYPMAVGDALPTLPIWLTADLRVMLPLEAGYQETCRVLGIP